MRHWNDFIGNESGATAIEYAVISGMISILIVAGATLIGSNLNTLFFTKLAAALP